MINVNFANDRIRKVDLWGWKRPLYQLSHNSSTWLLIDLYYFFVRQFSSQMHLFTRWVICAAEYLKGSGGAIAQWISLRLPYCIPGFESQAHHLCFFHSLLNLVLHLSLCWEKDKSKQKEVGFGPRRAFARYLNAFIFTSTCWQKRFSYFSMTAND